MNETQTTSDSTATREFYVPATFQFSTEPGRIERSLARLFTQRGAMDGHPPVDEREYQFYAPGTTGAAFARRGGRPRPR